MQLVVQPKPSPTPLWVVSDGNVTIGPVRTELLLRGIRHGRVPEDCRVRESQSEVWRPVRQIREVAGLFGEPGSVLDFQRAAAGFREAHEEREVLFLLLHGAVHATRAPFGLLHRLRAPFGLLITSGAFGGLEDSLGCVVPAQDPAYALARAGEPLRGAAGDGLTTRLVAERLGDGDLAGVIMVPVTFGTELVAMLELGRRDRRFRASDADELARLATLAIARLEELLD